MFRGNHPTRVDEKGRLKVPAEFKRTVDEKYGAQFYITSATGRVARDISLRGMAADRGKAVEALELQSGEEELSYADELLRSASGDGCAGPVADAADAARSSGDQGRSGSDGNVDLPGSAEHGSGRTQVEGPRSRRG